MSPTPAKNLGLVQRAFVLGIENIDVVDDRTFKLIIANQPCNAPEASGDTDFLPNARASWRQLPFGPTFAPPEPAPVIEEFLTVPAQSTDYITLFVVAPPPVDFGPSPITVYAYAQDVDNDPTGDFPGVGDVDHNDNGILDDGPLGGSILSTT